MKRFRLRSLFGILSLVLVLSVCAMCSSGDDDDDDDNNDAPAYTDKCEAAVKTFYNDCTFQIDALTGPEALDHCAHGGIYWQCMIGCYVNTKPSCDDFAACEASCVGDPHQEPGDEEWDGDWNDGAPTDDDDFTDDDVTSGGICTEGLTAFFDCGFEMVDEDNMGISLAELIAMCEDGEPTLECLAECGIEETSCDDIIDCFMNCV